MPSGCKGRVEAIELARFLIMGAPESIMCLEKAAVRSMRFSNLYRQYFYSCHCSVDELEALYPTNVYIFAWC